MLRNLRFGGQAASGPDERIALEKGIAEAQASMNEAQGSAHADLRAILTAFIEQAQRRIAELGVRVGR